MAGEMPCAAVLAAVHPELCTAFDETLFRRVFRLRFVVIHDFRRGGATLWSEKMHIRYGSEASGSDSAVYTYI